MPLPKPFPASSPCNRKSQQAGQAIVLATAYDTAVAALASLGDLHDKVVIDITNPLTADYMGLTLGHSTSAAEEIAKAAPGAEVVKAFNVFAQVLAEGGDFGNGQTVPVFVAGVVSAPKASSPNLPAAWGSLRSMPAR